MIDYLDEVIGQETAKRFVRTAIKKGNLYNFLLAGPKGVGKRLFGFCLAKTIGCAPHSPNFILIGPIPSKIKEKEDKIFEYSKKYLPQNPVIEIEDRASILIEQIRRVIERTNIMPDKDTKRVVLIIEADRMTEEAGNCFLKILEEPPLDTVFILTTSRPNYLLPTIRSRCQVVPFNYLKEEEIKMLIFEGQDEFKLGSPGEILVIREDNLIEEAYAIFKGSPLATKTAAAQAKNFEQQGLVKLFYPLLILYRLVLYKKLGLKIACRYEDEISKKADKISLEKIIETVSMLNYRINMLEENPNPLLLLFNTLLELP